MTAASIAKIDRDVDGALARIDAKRGSGSATARGSQVTSALAGSASPFPANWKLDRVGDLLGQPAPTQWLLRGYLDVPSIACVFGAPGSGKSFLAVDIACHIATGRIWQRRKAKAGPVVYLAGEGHAGIRRRFLAWQEHHHVDLRDAPIYLSSAAIDLAGNIATIVDTIKATVNGINPVLVALDTLHRHLTPGADENSSTDTGALIAAGDAIKDAFGCAVVFVHHTGHNAPDRERGSSALRGAWDWSYNVQRGDNGPMLLTCRKAKDHEAPEPMQFNLRKVPLSWIDDEGEHETSAVLELTGAAESALGANALLAWHRCANSPMRPVVSLWPLPTGAGIPA